MKKSLPQIAIGMLTALLLSLVANVAVIANENVYDSAIYSTTYIACPDTSSAGSGVLVDKQQRLVVTNEHVVSGSSQVLVFFPINLQGRICSDQEYYIKHAETLAIPARVIAVDSRRDIALLQLESVPPHIQQIEIGESARPGQMVHSIGNPDSSDAMWVYTNGYVRANYFKKMSDNRMQVVETSSPINPGDSGGPMLNDRGQLIGISQSYMTGHRLVSNGVDISEITWFVKKSIRDSAVANTPKIENRNDSLSTRPSSELLNLVASTVNKSKGTTKGTTNQPQVSRFVPGK